MTGKWMVSRGTRGMARWRSDSKELMFVGLEGDVVTVDVASGAAFQASAPKKLFQMPLDLLSNQNVRNALRYHARPAAAALRDARPGERPARASRRPQLAGLVAQVKSALFRPPLLNRLQERNERADTAFVVCIQGALRAFENITQTGMVRSP